MDVKLPIFVDTNVLIRANVVTAPLHAEALNALRRLRNADTELWISRQVLREYMVNVTRPQTFMVPLPTTTVIERVRYFESRFSVANDNAEVTAKLLGLLESIPMGGKQVHDANIVATMQVYGIRQLFTLNQADFERFADHITLVSLQDVLREK